MTVTQHTIALLFLSGLLIHFENAEASDDAVVVDEGAALIKAAPRQGDTYANQSESLSHGSFSVRVPFMLRRLGTHFRDGSNAPGAKGGKAAARANQSSTRNKRAAPTKTQRATGEEGGAGTAACQYTAATAAGSRRQSCHRADALQHQRRDATSAIGSGPVYVRRGERKCR